MSAWVAFSTKYLRLDGDALSDREVTDICTKGNNLTGQLMLKSYDPEHKCWDCEAGYYEVLAGNASDNISCKAKFLVKCRSIYNYNEKTMLCVIHADERAAKIIDAQLEALHNDVSDMADALYYFPHREIGQVLHSMLDHAPIDEAVKKQAYEQIFEAVGALDISEL